MADFRLVVLEATTDLYSVNAIYILWDVRWKYREPSSGTGLSRATPACKYRQEHHGLAFFQSSRVPICGCWHKFGRLGSHNCAMSQTEVTGRTSIKNPPPEPLSATDWGDETKLVRMVKHNPTVDGRRTTTGIQNSVTGDFDGNTKGGTTLSETLLLLCNKNMIGLAEFQGRADESDETTPLPAVFITPDRTGRPMTTRRTRVAQQQQQRKQCIKSRVETRLQGIIPKIRTCSYLSLSCHCRTVSTMNQHVRPRMVIKEVARTIQSMSTLPLWWSRRESVAKIFPVCSIGAPRN
jgi:hypothetical protein